MKCGKLTAKLRDAVPVCFIEEGKEIKRIKNIEIPDAIKELEYKGFKFDVPMSGAITFKIYFEPGTLPETWPEPRQRKTRAKKNEIAAPAGEDAAQDAPETAQEAADPQPEESRRTRLRPPTNPPRPPARTMPGRMKNRFPRPWRFTTTYPAVPARPWPAPSARSSAHTPAIRPLPASPTSSANTPWIGTAH